MSDEVDFTGSLGPGMMLAGKIKLASDVPLKDEAGNRIGTVTSIENGSDEILIEGKITDAKMARMLQGDATKGISL